MKRLIRGAVGILGYEIRRTNRAAHPERPQLQITPHEVEDGFREAIDSYPDRLRDRATTARLFTTYKAVEYVVRNSIPGDFLECGVFEGRHIFMMAKTLAQLGDTERDIYLYDTFAGMTQPGEFDEKLSRDLSVDANLERWQASKNDDHHDYCYSPIDSVRQVALSSGYPERRFHFIKGDIRETIPNDNHRQIAILRLDTDFYDTTKQELEHLYKLLVTGGVLIIDDYGSWAGCRKAVDEFFEAADFHPFLVRTDRSERVVIKLN